jgi:hypothetical protein
MFETFIALGFIEKHQHMGRIKRKPKLEINKGGKTE